MNNFLAMPVLTQEQQKIIADTCNVMVNRADSSEHSQNLRVVAQIALAALTAEPVGEVVSMKATVLDGMVDVRTTKVIRNALSIKRLPSGTKLYPAPPAPVLKPIELKRGALMISFYSTDPMNEDPVLCLSRDGVIEAIRTAGYEVKE